MVFGPLVASLGGGPWTIFISIVGQLIRYYRLLRGYSNHTCEWSVYRVPWWVRGGLEQPVWLLIRPYLKTTSQEPVDEMKIITQVMQPHPLPFIFYRLSFKGSEAVSISGLPNCCWVLPFYFLTLFYFFIVCAIASLPNAYWMLVIFFFYQTASLCSSN